LAAQTIDPIHQFQIHEYFTLPELGGMSFAFTNSALFMFAAVLLVTFTLVAGTASRALVPGRFQAIAELWYEFIRTWSTRCWAMRP